ncbi:glycogen accumulation regulator GarA [Peptococcaceae bacterium CEB3]|nr:glycogen accumulation regulator GarA [Peptococcaceae bacterium CEB3]
MGSETEMSLLARFEAVAEKLFTGAFKKNSARLQPVEIAKELVKVMLKHKQVSVSAVYVPNVYRVFLHSGDWSPLATFGDALLLELSKYLYQEGERYGCTFLTKPAIELHEDDTVNPREMFIEADFDDSIVVDWGDEAPEADEEEDWREQTSIFREEVKTNLPSASQSGRNPAYYLEVIEGPDATHIFPVPQEVFYLGRHSQCQIVLHDAEVSRRHLKVTEEEQGWLLDDLGSTNGTWVNDERITRRLVTPGEKIRLGQTVVVIHR